MKCKLSILFFLTFLSTGILSQVTTELEKGDRAYDNLSFDEALYFFEMANEQQPDDPEITRRIANTYRRMGQMTISAEWYEKAIESGSKNYSDLLFYADALKSLGQYDEAIVWYEKYNAIVPGDSRVKNHLRDPEYYKDLLADSLRYQMKSLAINNSDPVIGITAFENNSFLISAINAEKSPNEEKKYEYLNYLDIYNVELSADDELIHPVRLDNMVNTMYHEGPAFYSFANKTLYITRNNIRNGKVVLDKNGSVNLKIYESKFENGAWKIAQELKFSNDEYSYGHPGLSGDGKFMYLVSNKAGGIGGTDIYVAELNNGVWSEPVNLGPDVNTEGNEMFPMPGEDNRLYFSSDGHAGLGGLDIFYSENMEGRWLFPVNIGAPINSSSDDFSLLYRKQGDKGFFCSNRSGRGNDDIFFYHHVPLDNTIIEGAIKSKDASLYGERIRIVTRNTGMIAEQRLGDDGKFRFYGDPGDEMEVYMMDGIHFDTSVAVVRLKVDQPVFDPHTNIGNYIVEQKWPLPEGGRLSDQCGQSIISSGSYLKESLISSSDGNEVSGKNVQDIQTSNSSETPAGGRAEDNPDNFTNARGVVDLTQMSLDKIQFDFNKSYIREADKTKLDDLVKVVNDNTETKLFIKAYCDSRGGRAYNENLSMSRALAVKGYLIQKGISRNRLRTEWFGEEKPLNGCEDGVPCSEEEYEINRRAEFKLVSDRK